jgi:single-stranded DNA-specific DHH superfamily exonuclease
MKVHLVQKGSNIHEEHERELMLAVQPKFVIVLDQGSRGGPPVIDDEGARSLIIDHHLSDDFPQNAAVRFSSQVSKALTDEFLAGCVCVPLSTSSYYFAHHLRNL